ncbi:MAG: ligase-associated DNA damage response DEXH box helicase [Saprospiraceae bacterium]|nr:ligase-associated DNA damage response DEXH box helicase [Saprospiraceae bacterium]MBK8853685.1 ligase-associated DNA damage response DEXH box helicase [Saprospiraceae bacterium]
MRKNTEAWFSSNGWKLLPFQEEVWDSFLTGQSGLINAPTGSGKTYSVFLPFLEHWVKHHDTFKNKLSLIWITPIRALTQEILLSCTRACQHLNISLKIEMRTGDTTYSAKLKQFKNPPDVLITTPESLHVLFSQKGYSSFFSGVDTIVVDEWHELLGSKRGVQTELAIATIKEFNPLLKIWGISATIGNLKEAIDVLLFSIPENKRTLIQADITKTVKIQTILPDEIESYPWAGHLGLKLASKVLPILQKEGSCLVFTNTRAQCEIWYQHLLNLEPELAGIIAMHHGSISKELRNWVEDALYEGKLKVVICTSSLDLGVDFQPVDHIIQIGSPKGIARFIQRAGRSGHSPGKESSIYFLPTHGLELIEISAIREAMKQKFIESRPPMVNSWDVLIQFLTTLAVSEGFEENTIFIMLKKTHAFHLMDEIDFYDILNILVNGGQTLQAYDEFKKLERDGNIYKVTNPFIVKKHKLSIGTIVSESMIRIQMKNGKSLGNVEEWFISQISPGESFWFAGQSLELLSFRDMTALVKPSNSGKGKIPSYQGGRMPLSSVVSEFMRQKLMDCQLDTQSEKELIKIRPILDLQKSRSMLPGPEEFLIEYFETKEGFHLVMFPFEGRNVHEGMASFIAKRLSLLIPVSFTMSMNDYGFELLSDQKIDVEKLVTQKLFSTNNLVSDIYASINSVELARRKFREIAKISGLVFSGYPGKEKKARHLQASSQLIFEVFKEYEPENILFRQTFEEVLRDQLDENRMRNALERIHQQKWLFSFPQHPTPLSFPLLADRLREKISSEKLEDRIQKMTLSYK